MISLGHGRAISILFFENDIAVFVRIIVEAENFKYIIYKLTKNKSLAKQVYNRQLYNNKLFDK